MKLLSSLFPLALESPFILVTTEIDSRAYSFVEEL